MDVDAEVREHYGRDDLMGVVLNALRRAGVDPDQLRLEHLAGLDQLHAGSVSASEHVLDLLELSPASRLLDVGCGVGGPARLAAVRHGCRVTGIDLSPDFVELARRLTELLGLSEKVQHDLGSATDLPYDAGSFDRAMLVHVGMNLPDKASVLGEVHRVLDVGDRFVVYDQMRVGDGELVFPLPWAEDESTSFVETRDGYRRLLEAAGFRVEHDEDRTAANAAAGPPTAGGLGPGTLFGEGFEERLHNNIVAAMTGTLAAVVMVAVRV